MIPCTALVLCARALLAASCLLAVCIAAAAEGAPPTDAGAWRVTVASLWGGAGDQTLQACAADGRGIVYFGGPAGLELPGVPVVEVGGGGRGLLVRYDAVLGMPLTLYRLPAEPSAAAVASDGQVFVAAGGVHKLDVEAGAAVWSGPGGGRRLFPDPDGGVWAWSGGSAIHLDAEGANVGSVTAKGKDCAIDPVRGRVYTCGWRGARGPESGNPVHIPWLKARDLAGSEVWTMWNFSGRDIEAAGDMADSHPQRLCLDASGKLYMFGDSDGGNTAFRHDPQQAGGSIKEALSGTAFNEMWRAFRSVRMLFVCRIDPEYGTIERGTFFYGTWYNPDAKRKEIGDAEAKGIAADAEGRVYLTGVMRCRPQITANAVHRESGPMDKQGYWNNTVGTDESYLAIFEDDFRKLAFCSGFGQGSEGSYYGRGLNVAAGGGSAVMVGWAARPEGTAAEDAGDHYYLHEPFQAGFGGDKDGYLAILQRRPPPSEPVALARSALRRYYGDSGDPTVTALLAAEAFGPLLTGADDARTPVARAAGGLLLRIGTYCQERAAAAMADDPAVAYERTAAVATAWTGTPPGAAAAALKAECDADEAFGRRLERSRALRDFRRQEEALREVDGARAHILDQAWARANGSSLRAMKRIADDMHDDWPESPETAEALRRAHAYLIAITRQDRSLHRRLATILKAEGMLTVPKRDGERSYADKDFRQANARLLQGMREFTLKMAEEAPEHPFTVRARALCEELAIPFDD